MAPCISATPQAGTTLSAADCLAWDPRKVAHILFYACKAGRSAPLMTLGRRSRGEGGPLIAVAGAAAVAAEVLTATAGAATWPYAASNRAENVRHLSTAAILCQVSNSPKIVNHAAKTEYESGSMVRELQTPHPNVGKGTGGSHVQPWICFSLIVRHHKMVLGLTKTCLSPGRGVASLVFPALQWHRSHVHVQAGLAQQSFRNS